MKLRRLFFSLVFLTVPLAHGCDQADQETSSAAEVAADVPAVDPAVLESMPEGVTGEMVAQGRELFVTCTVCHGLNGDGTALGPSLRDSVWTHIEPSVPAIAQLVREGVWSPEEFETPMPEMGGGQFDDEQLNAVAAYVYGMSQDAL